MKQTRMAVAILVLGGMLASCVAVVPVPLGEKKTESRTVTKDKS